MELIVHINGFLRVASTPLPSHVFGKDIADLLSYPVFPIPHDELFMVSVTSGSNPRVVRVLVLLGPEPSHEVL